MTNGTQAYVEKIAKIRVARLGWEDRNIFTCWLDLDYGGSGQGAGGYCLDEPRHDPEGGFMGRFGTAFGMEFVMRLMRAVGVRDWSDVTGRTVLALLDGDGWGAKVVGIAPLPTEQGDPFVFDELRLEFGHTDAMG